MPWYQIAWTVIVKCETQVEADSPEDAKRIAQDEGWSYDKSYDEQPVITGIYQM